MAPRNLIHHHTFPISSPSPPYTSGIHGLSPSPLDLLVWMASLLYLLMGHVEWNGSIARGILWALHLAPSQTFLPPIIYLVLLWILKLLPNLESPPSPRRWPPLIPICQCYVPMETNLDSWHQWILYRDYFSMYEMTWRIYFQDWAQGSMWKINGGSSFFSSQPIYVSFFHRRSKGPENKWHREDW